VIIDITSATDERLHAFRWRERQLTTIAQRKSVLGEGMFIAEGDLVVRRALDAGCKPDVVLCDPKCAHKFADTVQQAGGTTLTASADIRREVTGLGVPLDAIGVFYRPQPADAHELIGTATRIIVLDCVDNPSNVGTIARSAAALGWGALLLDSTSADPLARRALRVSMGTTFKLPFARVSDVGETLTQLASRGFSIVGMTPNHSTRVVESLREIRLAPDQPRAVVLGSERQGLSDAALEHCNVLARIDMADGVDSLNVAAATAIACYALR
jgi:tRNA G18 (ribose-2'-O)-methylase SpoU